MRGGVALLVALAFVGACGYRFAVPPGELRSVAIRTPSNESFEPGVEYTVADALRREWLRRGTLALTENPEAADVVLSGKVLPIQTRGRTVSSVVLAIEYQLTLELELTATLRDGTLVPIDRRSLAESERYLASADVEATRKNRQEALRRVARVLAGRVYDSLSEGLAR